MSKASSIDFVLHGAVNGQDIAANSMPLPHFNEFNKQVETFIGGTSRLGMDDIRIEIVAGSYVLRALLPLIAMASLESDLKLLTREDVLGELDVKRADVIERWQARAKRDPAWHYEIRPVDRSLPSVKISSSTDFRIGDIVPWVAVEKYISGQIVDMGGLQKANIHIRLAKGAKPLIVAAAHDVLRDLPENRLYHSALLRVHAEEHFQTGDLRNVRLVEFVEYNPSYDADALDRFAAAGAEAWADVPDAAQWVREQRGG